MAKACCYCGKGPHEGVELRPYGPGGKPVCFPCSQATPERRAEARKRFAAALGGPGARVLTEDGPKTPEDVAGGLRCARCGAPPHAAEIRVIADTMRAVSLVPPSGRTTLPTVRGFVCEECQRARPIACARCSQPVRVADAKGGAPIVAVDDEGRPVHVGPCPDWLGSLVRDRDGRRSADAAALERALKDAERLN